jgi:putative transposase
MPRMARAVAVGVPHHVTQRGNNRQRIFDSDEDRLVYLKLLREYADRRRLVIWGYCLMDNHVHLIAAPQREDALARTLRQAHADYARYVNVKRRTSGHFWQNRYFSCALDGNYCWTALAYVERNPVRAGLTREAGEWKWSSAQWHLYGARGADWLDPGEWRKRYTPEQWREVLRTTVGEEAQAERIREATRTGRPMGAPGFVHGLERQLLRRLTPGKVGRPARAASEKVDDMFQAEEIGI